MPLRRTPIDADVARTPRVAIGAFRCPPSWPAFRDTGPIPECVVVFPRTAVWIRHAGARRFLADPTIVTIYNRGQPYERAAESPEGDRCDWFAVSDDLAREIAAAVDPSADDRPVSFRFAHAPSDSALYLRQRVLFARAARGEVGTLELEESVIGIVAAVLARATGHRPPGPRDGRTRARWIALAEAARMLLQRDLDRNRTVPQLATALGTSPYHLCRVFRAVTGTTLHACRRALRTRAALERLARAPVGGLSAMAHGLGYASHAHFVREMRAHVGAAPSVLQRQLALVEAEGE